MARKNKNKYEKIQNERTSFFTKAVEAKGIPAATGGWNTVSPLANMEPKYASIMQNWIPRPGYVELRGGYVPWCTGINSGTSIESLMVYRPASGSEKLFGATSTKIYDCTTQGAPAAVVTGLTSPARWQYVNFTPSGAASYLICCNGTNNVLNYDGAAWVGSAITVADPTKLVSVCSYQRRLWFTQINSTDLWYLDTDAVTGAATKFPVGPYLSLGSYVVGAETWTVDGGEGPRELLVIASSKGQLVIFMGTDPTNAATFSLVGVFKVGNPIGRRPFLRYGSELCILTIEGLIPLSKSEPLSEAGQRSIAFTYNIQPSIIAEAQASKDNFGWEVIQFPLFAITLINIPIAENSQQTQFVMANVGLGWSQFTGWYANCFAIFNDSLYFGGNAGEVNLAYAGYLDNTTPIIADVQHAFNTFELPSSNKHMTMLKPYIISDGTITPTLGVDVDFGNTSPTAPVISSSPTGATWGASLWGVGVWGSGYVTSNNWQSVNALGTFLAVRIKVTYGGPSGYSTTGITKSGQSIPILQVVEFLGVMSFGGPL